MTATTSSTEVALPVPKDALLELGLTEEQIAEAQACPPAVLAFQADSRPLGSWFDVDRVKKALRALANFKHTKGRWAGQSITLGRGLAPWQVVWLIAPVWGWVYFDEEIGEVVRVIRTVWLEIPRKNGKSTIASGLANVLLLADGEAGAEVYAAAGSKEQAGRVFEDARRMCLTSKAARKRVNVLAALLRVPKTGGIFRALSRIAETAHGLNVSGGVIDEVHVHKKRDLIDAIETGTGARSQPLIIFITTADTGEEGTIYDEKHTYTENCANLVVLDVTHYGVIWAADKDDDEYAEATWRKANPNLGISPTLSYLRKEANKARTTPSYHPTFLRLHLNVRARDRARLIGVTQWDDTAGMVTPLEQMAGRRAWGGLDLSAVSDMTAWWMGVESQQPGKELEFYWRFWVPEDRVPELQKQLQIPLDDWIKQGFVVATEGDVIDYAAVQEAIIADCRKVAMQRIGYDRMFAGQLVQQVDAELKGVQLTPVAQTYLGQSPSIKELLRLLGRSGKQTGPGRIVHGGNPVARWHALAVETTNDGNDNLRLVKPDRTKSKARIDGMSALMAGMDGYLRREKSKSKRMVVMGR